MHSLNTCTLLYKLSCCHVIDWSYITSWIKVSLHFLLTGTSRAKQIIQGGFFILFSVLLVTVACKKKCLKRNHLPKPSPTYLIIIKTQCAMRSLGTLRDPPLDSYHMQLASLINGVFTAGDVAVARVACLLTAGARPAVGNKTLIDKPDYHQCCSHIWPKLAPAI